MFYLLFFFFSSRRRHTSCALVTGVQTCALPLALLQHIPTALLLVAAPWLLRRWPLSTASVACIALFLALHTLGGRYAYSNVPYDDWARALTGASLSDARSEEHTSELQSLMRISYAVFCLNKKK